MAREELKGDPLHIIYSRIGRPERLGENERIGEGLQKDGDRSQGDGVALGGVCLPRAGRERCVLGAG